MRSLIEAKSRWDETFKEGSNIADLQRAVRFNGPSNPCAAGLRSVCWKAFLLWRNAPPEQWLDLARQSRAAYAALCEQHLAFIRHPERLATLSVDPLADDPDSPWITVRKDEAARAEILQDVRRLPDDPFYHEDRVQTLILDVLFLYCKLNPTLGGYRQGMHELLAPLVWVVAQDAVDRLSAATDNPADATVAELLDSAFVEHDAFALFSKLMESATAFYEVDSTAGANGAQISSIVERSKYIHEVALMKIDEELANHLRNIEVLPQIFVIRWTRLLFGREFDFEQLLGLWDALFAYDPALELINLICVAMLLRIRWSLLEADHSTALQLMLRYPTPPPPHGPHTFVDDAMYLRDHFDPAGGVTLIFKYTGKSPASTSFPTPAPTLRTSAPSIPKFNGLRPRTLSARSPLSTSARILQQPGGVEALLQGAAKSMLEKGEKLGINQAVRDVVGELRRNVQESRSPSRSGRALFGETTPPLPSHSLTIAAMERRNLRLAAMLDDSVSALKQLSASNFEGDKSKHLECVEIAAAKVQFVKACLEDPTLALPDEDLPSLSALSISSPSETSAPTVALDTTPVVMTSSAVEDARTALSSPSPSVGSGNGALPPKDTQPKTPAPESASASASASALAATDGTDKMDTDLQENDTLPPLQSELPGSPPLPPVVSKVLPDTPPRPATITPAEQQQAPRPHGPIPTRSTLAQSSFAWMLEPDTTASSPTSPRRQPLPPPRPFSSPTSQKKRLNPSRERNAFLFGEVTADGLGEGSLSTDQIFGLQPIRKI
ncbi:hypothetical protein VTJ83DRAFT_1047 [Remersonia thermophila]|uniref:Rab-GAP TBC domain-containing protein n=1 Tax=Remersonia thermophila TaxID=72144 RepID=A0ABR4DN87_9PEZI